MFHDSGQKQKPNPYFEGFDIPKNNRVCLHCGFRYGNHVGTTCPPNRKATRTVK